MKPINLVKFKGSNPAEIFQSLDIKFAFVNKNYEQVHLPIKCRDFLGDAIWSMKTGHNASIYSWSYNFIKKPYDVDKLRLSLKFPDLQSKGYFEANLHKLNEIEDSLKIKRTIIKQTIDKDTLVVEGSKIWQSNSWKISLYTFYLKLFSYQTVEEIESPEDKYYKLFMENDNWKKLHKKIKSKKEYIAEDIYTQHNYSGFFSIMQGKSNSSGLFGFGA